MEKGLIIPCQDRRVIEKSNSPSPLEVEITAKSVSPSTSFLKISEGAYFVHSVLTQEKYCGSLGRIFGLAESK